MKLTAFIAATLLGTTAMAQSASTTASTSSGWTFALHGFVSMSAGYQTGTFVPSEGQQSMASSTAKGAVDTGSMTADVRQSRFNFSVKGPQVLGGATPSGVLEIDFFNGFGAGNYGDVSIFNRMRVAYTELNWGANKLQFGQQNDLVFGLAPTSLSHIAFPVGYFTGNIGWRRPGIFGFHTLDVSPDLKIEGDWEIGRAQWADAPGAGNAGNPFVGAPYGGGITAGEASGGPALEGRIKLAYSKYLDAFVAAHYNNNDLSGYGAGGAGNLGQIQTVAYNGGLKLTVPLPNDMGLVVQGTGFTGKNVAPLIANLTTGPVAFRVGPQGQDVSTTGYWAQLGFNLTKEFSLWAFYGDQQVDKTDFARAMGAGNAYENSTTNLIAMYRTGGVAFSAEWINFQTKYADTIVGTSIGEHHTSTANQYLFTANYYF